MAQKKRKRIPSLHRWRTVSQVFFLLALNPYFFLYRGFCFPAMNCWACPAAAFGCPIGAIGHFLVLGLVPFLAVGVILLAGALVGRMICGWVCPFGFLQDLMMKVPVPKLRLPHVLSYLKYAVLAGMVFLVPLTFGIEKTESGVAGSDFFFCNYCPAGTLEAAIPVRLFGSRLGGETTAPAPEEGSEEGAEAAVAAGEEEPGGDLGLGGGAAFGDPELPVDEGEDWLASATAAEPPALSAGVRFWLLSPRMWVLYLFLAAFLFIRRPFCRAVCPIGALFSLLNRFSFFRLRVKKDACKECRLCEKHCPTDNRVYMNPASQDCVRCLECVAWCKQDAAKIGLVRARPDESYWE